MTYILLIEPSSSGLELLPTAKSMQLNTIVFTANKDERIIPVFYHRHINHLVEVDTYDIPALYALAQKFNQVSPLSAIIPGSEYHVPIASRLAEMMGLPGVSAQYVDNLRVKSSARKSLKKNSVRVPHFAIITAEAEILDASHYVKFPCVLKPIASAGSMHVSRANNLEQLTQAYKAMSSDPWTELGNGVGTTALIEQYINGEEFSVEGYIDNSTANIISITKKFLTPEPLFIEMGHIVPASIGIHTKTALESYVQAVIKALNINLGVFHAELRIDDQGPVLMEIAGRLPGCRICDLIQLSKDVNMYEIMLRAHLGWPINSNLKSTKQFSGMRYFALNGRNKFRQVNGLEKVQALPGFHEFKLLKKPEEYVPPLETFNGRVATCIFTAPTYDELIF